MRGAYIVEADFTEATVNNADMTGATVCGGYGNCADLELVRGRVVGLSMAALYQP